MMGKNIKMFLKIEKNRLWFTDCINPIQDILLLLLLFNVPTNYRDTRVVTRKIHIICILEITPQ